MVLVVLTNRVLWTDLVLKELLNRMVIEFGTMLVV